MNFERGKDVKEVLKIGRKANAIPLDYMGIQGELLLKMDTKKLDDKVRSRYNIASLNCDTINLHKNIEIKDASKIICILEILDKWGICKDLHEYFLELAVSNCFITGLGDSYGDLPIIMDKNTWEFKFKFAFIISLFDIADLPDTFRNQTQLSFRLTGRDILYRDKLYRIAEPKDGY
jgi:hypothetical protein